MPHPESVGKTNTHSTVATRISYQVCRWHCQTLDCVTTGGDCVKDTLLPSAPCRMASMELDFPELGIRGPPPSQALLNVAGA